MKFSVCLHNWKTVAMFSSKFPVIYKKNWKEAIWIYWCLLKTVKVWNVSKHFLQACSASATVQYFFKGGFYSESTVFGGKFKFQVQDSFSEYFFFEIWRSKKRITLSEKKPPLGAALSFWFTVETELCNLKFPITQTKEVQILSDAKANIWMFKSAEYVPGRIKPKVFLGENAPMLFTKKGHGWTK